MVRSWLCVSEAAAGHHRRDGDSQNVGREQQHCEVWLPLRPARTSLQSCCSYHQEQWPRYDTLTCNYLRFPRTRKSLASCCPSHFLPPGISLIGAVNLDSSTSQQSNPDDLSSLLAPCPVRVTVAQVWCMGVTISVAAFEWSNSLH